MSCYTEGPHPLQAGILLLIHQLYAMQCVLNLTSHSSWWMLLQMHICMVIFRKQKDVCACICIWAYSVFSWSNDLSHVHLGAGKSIQYNLTTRTATCINTFKSLMMFCPYGMYCTWTMSMTVFYWWFEFEALPCLTHEQHILISNGFTAVQRSASSISNIIVHIIM